MAVSYKEIDNLKDSDGIDEEDSSSDNLGHDEALRVTGLIAILPNNRHKHKSYSSAMASSAAADHEM
jgi:hypothetical protein